MKLIRNQFFNVGKIFVARFSTISNTLWNHASDIREHFY